MDTYNHTGEIPEGRWWNPNAQTLNGEIKYMICQVELAPTTGQAHWQGYVEFKKPCRIPQAKAWIGCEWAHLERRAGTRDQARDYCRKAESRAPDAEPFEFGEFGESQGSRSDISNAVNKIKNGASMLEILTDSADTFVRYHRGLTAAQQTFLQSRFSAPRPELRVTVLIGPPGCGKTRSVWDSRPDAFTLTQSATQAWWDGYSGQNTILLDDYYGWLPWGELLKVLDIYPLRLAVKGSFTWAGYTEVFITSNRPWHQWYKRPDQAALKRRIHEVRTYTADGEFTSAGPEDQPPPEQYAEGFVPP